MALQYASKRVRSDPEIVLAAAKQNRYALRHACGTARTDPLVRLANTGHDVQDLHDFTATVSSGSGALVDGQKTSFMPSISTILRAWFSTSSSLSSKNS